MSQVINVILTPETKTFNVTMSTTTPQVNVQAFQSALPYRVTIGATPPPSPSENDIWIQV